MIPGAGGGDLAGRFGAWWNGKEYVAPPPSEDAPDSAPAEKAPKPEKAEKPVAAVPAAEPAPAEDSAAIAQPSEIRLKALSTIWGEGRFTPGSHELETRLLDPLFEGADKVGDIGFIGADAALLRAASARTGRKLVAVEWRTACIAELQQCPGVEVVASDLDRPKGFADGSLEGLVSIEAFAYADHKAGLVNRAHRALSATGCWVFLDTTRTTNKTPPAAFASAWAEPQVTTDTDIENLLTMTGFKSVTKVSATEEMLYAARAGYARLAYALEEAATGGFKGREGALFLQELAWEAQSWRARCRAFEGGALHANLWIARKTAPKPVISREPGLDPVAEALFS
jgi:hypothetical protein